MKMTVIIRNLSDAFWHGNEDSIPSFIDQSPHDRLENLKRLSSDLPEKISFKVGDGSIRDRVEWNFESKKPGTIERMTSKIEPRRGYRLVTFEF